MIQSAEINGSGIAAQACCAILRRFGWSVNSPETGNPVVPYLIINEVTAQLIRDIFGVFVGELRGREISRRMVVPRVGSALSRVNEAAWVISAAELMALIARDSCQRSVEPSAWRIFAGQQPPAGALISSGNRIAWIFQARGRSGSELDAVIFEVTPDGWLFWAPTSARDGFLQVVLPAPEPDVDGICRQMLGKTHLLKDHVRLGKPLAGPLPCAAALQSHLTGTNWIASGTSALRFDPISGHGTGTSLRSAILTSAVLRASMVKSDAKSYFEHYKQRSTQAFQSHIMNCLSLYMSAGLSEVWTREIDIMRQLGSTRLEESKTLRFSMRDYSLTSANGSRN
jgi:hypothetical protein